MSTTFYDKPKFYIGGAWTDPLGSESVEVINPATEAPCGRISLGTEADVDRAVSAALEAQEAFAATSRDERIALLERIVTAYKARYEDIATAIMLEMGAPWSLAKGSQAGSGVMHFKTAARALRDFAFGVRTGSTLVMKEAIGVAGLITPWNWPANQVACKVAPAIAAGCTMVLKPSEIAPFDAMILAEVMDAAGVPAGVFNLVNGDGLTVGRALASHPDVAIVSFTGSTRAGIDVAAHAAASVKRVAQELGGKSANILLDDCDFEAAVTKGAEECFENTGQSCDAPTRMLVPADRLDEAAAIAAAVAGRMRVGDPLDSDTELGPVASGAQWDKVQQLIQVGIDEGARLVAGGTGRPDGIERGFFVRPTVFSDVSNDMRIAQEEIFGPVLSILAYRSDDEAVAIANDTAYGLSNYIASGDIERARNLARRLKSGMVHINYASLDPMAPFGGYKQSGNGREWGPLGIEEFLDTKSIYGFEA